LKEDEAQRLKQGNARLKKIVAEQALDISLLKDLQRGNWWAHRVDQTQGAGHIPKSVPSLGTFAELPPEDQEGGRRVEDPDSVRRC
jgi:hypothetical protein